MSVRCVRWWRACAFVAMVAVLCGCSVDPPLDTAPNVDLSQMQGVWYEIAKLPRPTQADCWGTMATYTRAGDGLDLVNECRVGGWDGPRKVVSMSARPLDGPAKLGLDVSGFFGDFWILEIGADYEYVAIGHPSRAYLWILARTAKPDPAVIQGVVTRMQEKHFDTTKLEYTPQ